METINHISDKGDDLIDKAIKSIDTRDMIKHHNLIKAEHSAYLKTNPEMAASLQCCSYLLSLYEIIQPKQILDLGSGISSYCFRLFKKANKLDTEIHSIDSSATWLKRSMAYCQNSGLDSTNFKTWDNFIKEYAGIFDLVFMDIDNSTNRHSYFKPVFDKFCDAGTIVLFDDMHKTNIVNPFDKFMKTRQYTEYDIKDLTVDKFGRFSRVIKVK